MAAVNLSIKEDYAVFLPAVSGFYTEVLGRSESIEGYLPEGRWPKGLPNGWKSLDFFDPELGQFFYDKGLYSAGHAYLDLEKSKIMESMIQNRDRSKVTIVGDSGGFQIGKGVIKFDWENFYEQEGDEGYVGEADKVRLKILNWLEETADWSMTLDVPSWATKNPKLREMTGLKTEQDALDATVYNLEFFMKHKKGKTKWLNVLQGIEWEDAERWYQAVKDFDCQGWAMGGNHTHDVGFLLRRILRLRDDGLLQDRDWMHVLGNGRLDSAVMFTAIQRQVRKHVNPNWTLSLDCASPFIATANALVYSYNSFLPDRFTYLMDSCFDNKDFKYMDIPFPFDSSLGSKLTVADICNYGKEHAVVNGERRFDVTEEEANELKEAGLEVEWVPACMNKINKVGKTSWDSFSYALLMAHNVEMHIRAVRKANYLTDIELVSHGNPNWRRWTKTKKRDKSKEMSNWVPRNLLYFNSFVEELFTAEDPYALLDEAEDFLQNLCHNTHKSDNSSMFDSLFDQPEDTVSSMEGEFNEQDPDNEAVNALDELENLVRDDE